MRDSVPMNQLDRETLAMKMTAGDCHNVHMTGQITDRIFKNGELVEEIVGNNLVVNSFLNLVMCLLKQQSGYAGIQYWAVGSGADTWDITMPTPSLDSTKLTSEIGRVAILPSEVSFLNNSHQEVSTPTNILQIKHTFGANECNGVWREFGIFGGNATNEANSGVMINRRHHAVITKTEEMTIERTMRFTLSLV